MLLLLLIAQHYPHSHNLPLSITRRSPGPCQPLLRCVGCFWRRGFFVFLLSSRSFFFFFFYYSEDTGFGDVAIPVYVECLYSIHTNMSIYIGVQFFLVFCSRQSSCSR